MRHFRHAWAGLWVIAILLLGYPINSLTLRIALIVSVAAGYIATTWRFRQCRPLLYCLLIIPLVIAAVLLLPGRAVNKAALKNAYLASLRSYTGTRYIWGGENRLGVDCSGLVRVCLINANIRQGFTTMNPKPLRHAISLWWHDCSARALGEEYRAQTKLVLSAPGINSLNPDALSPGNIAVTQNGVHVLAYLGGNEWIEADPHDMQVVIVRVPAKQNPWFNTPVNILRWTELQED